MTNWIETDYVDNLDFLYETLHKVRHKNRFERYFPSGKRRPKYYSPPRNEPQDVQ